MKRWIHENEDWRTDTDDPMANAFRQIMADSIDDQDNPELGIFWYDPYKEELFGIREIDAEDREFQQTSLFPKRARTCKPLHEKVWKKEHFAGNDPRFKGDYTKMPRGRIFEVEDDGFYICVGPWIEKHPEAKDKILERFNLPKDSKFYVNIH